MRQKLLQNVAAFLLQNAVKNATGITKRVNFITKRGIKGGSGKAF